MSVIVQSIAIIVVLTLLNGLLAAAEVSLMNVRTPRIDELAESGNAAAIAIRKLLDDRSQLEQCVAHLQGGITITSIAPGMYLAYAMTMMANNSQDLIVTFVPYHPILLLSVVAIVVVTFLHGIVGEMIPRSLALHAPEQVAIHIYPLIALFKTIIAPCMLVPNILSSAFLWLLHIPKALVPSRIYSHEELEQVVTESHRGGLLSDEEQRIIQNIFNLSERRIGQVMTPRLRMEAIPVDITREELQHFITSFPYSRFPVYDNDLDHIIGLLLVKDVVRYTLEEPLDDPDEFNLHALLRHIPAVPETMMVDRLLMAFKKSHIHMAIVFDEYGVTSGVVTLDDVVEEVVGTVHDEFHVDDMPLLYEIAPGTYLARGDLMLDDLRVQVPGAVPNDDDEELPDVDTLGGMVVSWLGRPAMPGDAITMHDTCFTVESVSGFAIDMVRIECAIADDNKSDTHVE